ncbi:hypothetical protein BG004_000333 [Podila humilis]|nr:hypothetical protein BG004_000333 [Podila humilis]
MLLQTLAFTVAIAAVALGAPIGRGSDPCSHLARMDAAGTTTYQDVSNCYKSIPLQAQAARSAWSTMHTAYNDFLVFRDAALTPNLQAPFSSPPVDCMAKLEEIRTKQYVSDYDFHDELDILAMSFNDPHINCRAKCYSSYAFMASLFMYTSVDQGKQVLRVLVDPSPGGALKDCEVVTIDGEPALTYVQTFADNETGLSKDPGVRLNGILPSMKFNTTTKFWGFTNGAFAVRTRLPATKSLTVTFNCPAQSGPFTKTIDWKVVTTPKPGTFSDRTSFVSKVCMVQPTAPTAPEAQGVEQSDWIPYTENPEVYDLNRRFINEQYEEHKRNIERRADAPATTDDYLPDATLVDSDKWTAVYQLKSDPSVGILAVPTMLIEPDGIAFMQDALTKLAQRNVTRIIIDTTGNGGGYTALSVLLPTMFFPSLDYSTVNNHLSEYRISSPLKALFAADFANQTIDTTFEPTNQINGATGRAFANNFYLNPVKKTLNGREAEYSEKFYGGVSGDSWGLDLNKPLTNPWTNDASKITILTDGRCGSACGMAVDVFVQKHGVKAVGVGGYSGQDLSMFSFAGASVKELGEIALDFEELGVAAPYTPLPYAGTYRVSIYNVYSGNDDIMLEYNPARHPSTHRLQYTNETVRRHDLLWGEVAKTAWVA